MKRWLILSIALILLCGCTPVAREPDNLDLVRVLGVDGTGPVTLTAACSADNQKNVSRGSTTSETFEQARKALPWTGDGKELSLTGVSYLLVGPDVDLEEILFAVLEDSDLGASATVWLTEGGAGEVLAASEDPAGELGLMALQNSKAPTVAQAVAALTTEREVELPCLVVQNGRLEERGTSRWKESN